MEFYNNNNDYNYYPSSICSPKKVESKFEDINEKSEVLQLTTKNLRRYNFPEVDTNNKRQMIEHWIEGY